MNMFQVIPDGTPVCRGKILIASPFLPDHNFMRSVILLIDHDENGSMGIVLNQQFKSRLFLNDRFPRLEFAQRIPIFRGGPVNEQNTIFFLHSLSQLEGALELGEGLFLGGDFNFVQDYILSGESVEGTFRFFAGYAGWKPGKLQKEIFRQNSWVVSDMEKESILSYASRNLWHESLVRKGGNCVIWTHYPELPVLN